MRDITPETEQDDDEYETAGNLICLPGAKLADVLNAGTDQRTKPAICGQHLTPTARIRGAESRRA